MDSRLKMIPEQYGNASYTKQTKRLVQRENKPHRNVGNYSSQQILQRRSNDQLLLNSSSSAAYSRDKYKDRSQWNVPSSRPDLPIRTSLQETSPKSYDPRRYMSSEQEELNRLKNSLQHIPTQSDHENRIHTADRDPADRLISKIKKMDQLNIDNLTKYVDDMATKHKVKPVLLKTKPPTSKPIENTLSVRILSTWGDAYLVGVTSIELLAVSGEMIAPLGIFLRNNIGGAPNKLERIIDKVNNTTDSKHMYVETMPAPPVWLEICIQYPLHADIGGIRIWNYNSSLLESIKGIKAAEVFVNHMLAWEGTVSRANGHHTRHNATEIIIDSNFQFPAIHDEEVKDVEPKAPVWYHKPIKVHTSHLHRGNLHRNMPLPQKSTITPEAQKEENADMPLHEPNNTDRLRESQESLEVFKHTQQGRLGGSRKRRRPLVPQKGKPRPVRRGKSRVLQIPELPTGRVLQLIIRTTWGDQHYVGLSSVEIWNANGQPIKIGQPSKQVSANPSDVNILPGYNQDPRTVDKLVDGVHWTCDDLHVWLAPFTEGKLHTVTIDLLEETQISMIRIWNYNKSRIHSYRGAKDVEIWLDGAAIFRGEIDRAPGRITNADQKCEYVLFTQDSNLLEAISATDWVGNVATSDEKELDLEIMNSIRNEQRPGTGDRKHVMNQPSSLFGEDGRPLTVAITPQNMPKRVSKPNNDGIQGSEVRLELLDTWGDAFYTGLTGLALLGENGTIISNFQITASPQDMNVIEGHSGDYRTLDKLSNAINQTTDDQNMWLIPYYSDQERYIHITLERRMKITGLQLWNYNKSSEDTYRGIKRVNIKIDGQIVSGAEGIVLRKAPGNDLADFGQIIDLPVKPWSSEEARPFTQKPVFASSLVKQEYETPYLPMGYQIWIRFLTTWGDLHYVGLNGIELYDHKGRPILSDPYNEFTLISEPPSVNSLPGMNSDVRTVDKLYDGITNTYDDRHMWLAPYINCTLHDQTQPPNQVSFTFDKQICISAIKLWNYGKTPQRGAKEIEIILDDAIIYKGYARIADATSIIFSAEREEHKELVYCEPDKMQAVAFYNEGTLLGGAELEIDEGERPITSNIGNCKV